MTVTSEDVFNAIAEPRRREVIGVLADGAEYSVGQIVVQMKMAQPSVSKHLIALRKAGVVTVVQRGQHRMYQLQPKALKPVQEWLQTIEQYWNHNTGEIRRRAEKKALDRLIRLDDKPRKEK